MWWRTLALGGSLLALLGACSNSNKEKLLLAQLSESCTLHSDCEPPLVCAFERCHVQCNETRDCPPGQRCMAGGEDEQGPNVCSLPDEVACGSRADCHGAQECADDNECRDGCDASAQCIGDQVCAESQVCAEPDEVDASGLLSSPGKSSNGSGSGGSGGSSGGSGSGGSSSDGPSGGSTASGGSGGSGSGGSTSSGGSGDGGSGGSGGSGSGGSTSSGSGSTASGGSGDGGSGGSTASGGSGGTGCGDLTVDDNCGECGRDCTNLGTTCIDDIKGIRCGAVLRANGPPADDRTSVVISGDLAFQLNETNSNYTLTRIPLDGSATDTMFSASAVSGLHGAGDEVARTGRTDLGASPTNRPRSSKPMPASLSS